MIYLVVEENPWFPIWSIVEKAEDGFCSGDWYTDGKRKFCMYNTMVIKIGKI